MVGKRSLAAMAEAAAQSQPDNGSSGGSNSGISSDSGSGSGAIGEGSDGKEQIAVDVIRRCYFFVRFFFIRPLQPGLVRGPGPGGQAQEAARRRHQWPHWADADGRAEGADGARQEEPHVFDAG